MPSAEEYPLGAVDHATGGLAARLDRATNSAARGQGWWVTEHVGCSEITVLPLIEREEREYVGPGEGADPERAGREAQRRAGATLRRYCVLHVLNRLWTLTFANEPETEADAWREVELFRKRLQRAIGKRIPLAVALEHGGKSGRLHFHMAAGEWLDKELVRKVWGLGHVDGRKIRAGGSGGARARARRAASYLAKYVSKERALEPGTHRYSTTRGMAPVRRSHAASSLRHAVDWSRWRLGQTGEVTAWCSSSSPDWAGPPVWLFFGEDP